MNITRLGSNAIMMKTGEGRYQLVSYDTVVCSFIHGELIKHWNGYSSTTMRHINLFLEELGQDPINKRIWDSLPISEV